MSKNTNTVVAFDLYGTLLPTESIASNLGKHFGREKAAGLAAAWRRHQLEYTWRLNSMGRYEHFSTVTRRSLRHTLSESNLTTWESAVDELMHAYDSLSAFPDVPPALETLAKTPGITAVVFSNGTQSMVLNSILQSTDLAPYARLFGDLVVVEQTKRFKPDPSVYKMLARRMEKDEASMEDIWLVSGNSFDIVGAKAVGMKAIWVDRQGTGWVDKLFDDEQGTPSAIVNNLGGVVQTITRQASN